MGRHLFEALLALHDATGSKEIFNEAEAHANAIFTKLVQERSGYLPEFYDADWKPLPVGSGPGYLEIGHQFEWTFLLSHAVDKGFPKRYLQIGERLLDYGMKSGYDREQGGIFSRGDYNGNATKGPKGVWQQCEFLHALMNYAAVRNRGDLWEPFDKSLEMYKRHFIDSEYGGAFSSYHDPNTASDNARLGKSGINCYHVCGMYLEALRLTGIVR